MRTIPASFSPRICALLACSVVSLFGACAPRTPHTPGPPEALQGDLQLEVANGAQSSICFLYVVAAAPNHAQDDAWLGDAMTNETGRNWLANPLPPGEHASFSVRAGVYHVEVQSCVVMGTQMMARIASMEMGAATKLQLTEDTGSLFAAAVAPDAVVEEVKRPPPGQCKVEGVPCDYMNECCEGLSCTQLDGEAVATCRPPM
jgi:hypothetical protein